MKTQPAIQKKKDLPPNWKMSDVDSFRNAMRRLDEILKEQMRKREQAKVHKIHKVHKIKNANI